MKDNRYFTVLRILFALSILFFAGTILSGILPALICWIFYYACLVLSILICITSIILFVIQVKENNNIAWPTVLIALIMLLSFSTVFFTKKSFVLLHSYTEVQRYLKNNEIVNKYNYKILNTYDKYYDKNKCEYVFNVKEEDQFNTVFQAAYCDCSTMWTNYCVINNYATAYKETFYNNYKKIHNITFEMKKSANSSWNNAKVEFIYDDSNVAEYCQFVKEYKKNTQYNFVDVQLEDEDCYLFNY